MLIQSYLKGAWTFTDTALLFAWLLPTASWKITSLQKWKRALYNNWMSSALAEQLTMVISSSSFYLS